MNGLIDFLSNSYTAYQAVERAERFLIDRGFSLLKEEEPWSLREGGKYYVIRNGSSLIAFTLGGGNKFKIVASHTDSPCLKLKEHPLIAGEPFRKLNAEPYGGGIWYSFFDRPLKIAGRIVKAEGNVLTPMPYVSPFQVVIPSLAVHMQRDVNEKFAPNAQIDLLPLLSLDDVGSFEALIGDPVAYDLYVAPAEQPFTSGVNGEFISAPRIDNLTSVYSSLEMLAESSGSGVCVAACLDNEEIGSHTRQGAASDFLRLTLKRIAACRGVSGEDLIRAYSSSFLISLDNAHSLHPNHAEKCDLTNRAVAGGGVVIKSHAGGAYTTDALTLAVVKTLFDRAGVKYQTFYNRSDMRSGGTLGAISLGQVSIPSADLGIAQLAMHAAVETIAKNDYFELKRGLAAFYAMDFTVDGSRILLG